MKIAFLKNKNRNDSISIGAMVIMDELQRMGITVDICNYQTAFNYNIVLISMTDVGDIYDLFANMKKYHWENRTFTAIVGGFGCQNPFALEPFVDYAYFGRADGDLQHILDKNSPHLLKLSERKIVYSRQVSLLYPYQVRYGKNCSTWTENFIGCRFRCKFCHYSWNRAHIGNKTYVNDGISTGSPEIMLKDICSTDQKYGRFTTALDGYSERLRLLFGKKISWETVEESLDHIAQFKGNTYMKLYNIHNFPTETEADREEFISFFKYYTESTGKADGVVTIDVFNTAFRPSLNTPMQRMPVSLYPEARQEINKIAASNGFSIRYTPLTKGAWAHLSDVIAIRYTDSSIIDFIATDKEFNKLNDADKIKNFVSRFDITDYIRAYDLNEPFLSDMIKTNSEAIIRTAEIRLLQKIKNANYGLA
jgi:hypothetical protein